MGILQKVSGPDTDLVNIFCLPGRHWDVRDDLLALLAQMEDAHILLKPLVYEWVLRMEGDNEGCGESFLFGTVHVFLISFED